MAARVGGGVAPVADATPPPALVVAPGATAAFAVPVTGVTLGAYGRCAFTVSVDGVAKAAQVAAFVYAPPAGAPPLPLPPPTTTTPVASPTATDTSTPTPVASPPATATPTPSAVPPPATFTPLLTFTATFPTLAAASATPAFQTHYRTTVAAAAGVPLASVRVVAASPGVTIATAAGVTLTTEVAFPAATSTAAADAFGASLELTNGGMLTAAGACACFGGVGAEEGGGVANHHPLSPPLFSPPASTTRPHPHHRLRHRHRGLRDARHPVSTTTATAAHDNCARPRLPLRPARLLGARHPRATLRVSVRLGVGHDSAAGERERVWRCFGVCVARFPPPPPPPLFPPQDLANYKFCGVLSDVLGQVDPPAPAPPPPPGSPRPPPPPPPPSSSPASRLWQILTQLKSLSGRQIVVAAGGLALVATLGFCVFMCCARCGLCPCLPASCGGGRRRRRRRALADDDNSDDGGRGPQPRQRRGSVAAMFAARRARRAEAEARLFEAVEVEAGAGAPLSLTSLADVAALAGGAWRGPPLATSPAPPPDAVTSALVEALRRAAASSPLSPPPASQASAEMVALLAALQGGRQQGGQCVV